MRGLVEAALALAAATALHVTLRRGARSLRARMEAARRSMEGEAAPSALVRLLDLLCPLAIAAVWVSAAWLACERVPALAALRQRIAGAVRMSLEMPIFGMGDRRYSALDIIEVPALLFALWVATDLVVRVLRSRLFRGSRRGGSGRGMSDAAAFILRYVLLFVGGIVVLQASGVDTSSFAFLASIVGVGLGFGMQHLANNVVSGIVIGLERPVQSGDYVKVGELTGTVERIGARSTLVRTLDNVSILVPNSRFLESEVVNWTHGDPVSRIHVPVGVAYGSDPRRVRSCLLDAARSHPDVLPSPRPRVEHLGFGDSSLAFDLLVWTRDPRGQHRLRSDLYFRAQAALARAGIEIPFPQRDLHVKSRALEPLLEAAARRFGAELPPVHSEPPAAERTELLSGERAELLSGMPAPADEIDDDIAPASWRREHLASVAERLRGAVEIRDRRYLLETHPRCFVGREAVAFLRASEGLTRDEALVAGQRMIEAGLFHHVLDDHDFRDGNYFYRFHRDE